MADEGTCRGCGSLLKREEWNSTTDIVVCDNSYCQFFRTPVSNTDVGKRELKAPKEPKQEIPEWLGETRHGTKNTSYAYRLQRLQRYLYPKD